MKHKSFTVVFGELWAQLQLFALISDKWQFIYPVVYFYSWENTGTILKEVTSLKTVHKLWDWSLASTALALNLRWKYPHEQTHTLKWVRERWNIQHTHFHLAVGFMKLKYKAMELCAYWTYSSKMTERRMIITCISLIMLMGSHCKRGEGCSCRSGLRVDNSIRFKSTGLWKHVYGMTQCTPLIFSGAFVGA